VGSEMCIRDSRCTNGPRHRCAYPADHPGHPPPAAHAIASGVAARAMNAGLRAQLIQSALRAADPDASIHCHLRHTG